MWMRRVRRTDFLIARSFFPAQSVCVDFYVRDEYWPDFDPQHFENVLA
jgi:undecaprenyl pyrophosphate synthase